MSSTALVSPGLHLIKTRASNAYLLETDPGLTLVDCGMPGSGEQVAAAIRAAGHAPDDVKRIIVTHAHKDHFGGLAEVKKLTGAEAWMHPIDARLVRAGGQSRATRRAPGLAGVLYPVLKPMFGLGLPPVDVEHEVQDGETLPGGIQVIHCPGASAGQVALLWQHNLIAGDVFSNISILRGHQFGYEDLAAAQASMRRLVARDFENAVFGHGAPIVGSAAAKMRQKFRRTMGVAPAVA